MKTFKLILCLFTALFSSKTLAKPIPYPVHIMPDAPSESYDVHSFLIFEENQSSPVNEAIRVGKRNMEWLKYMNEFKPEDQKIALTKPGDLKGIPITEPRRYSPAIIGNTYQEIAKSIPASMRAIIFENAAFTKDPDVEMDVYIEWAKKVDKMYQSASRWNTLQPYMPYYTQNKENDIRGYYFLTKEDNLQEKLQGFLNLSLDDQTRLKTYLVNLCENSKGVNSGCERHLTNAIQQNTVHSFFTNYFPTSKKLFESYFQIPQVRPDLVWSNQTPDVATIPIRITPNNAVNDFLKVNIEDEWKWESWKLNLNFTPNADVHVVFKPGVTPNVNGIAGNKITMDANAPLTEWDVQWTIRHEFGHVLGFPDCYVEFYDSSAQEMVNYQIDIENLMCSRAGRLQETHYLEMKKNYFE